MRVAATFLIAATAAMQAASDPAALDIVRRSCERETRNLELRQKYTFRESLDQRKLAGDGSVKDKKAETREVLWIDGSRHTILVARDGKPLPEPEAQKQKEKLDREIAKQKRESLEQRRKRLAEREKDLEEERAFRRQIPDAFHFSLLGEETVNGRECYKVSAEPREDFRPKGREAGILKKVRGTIWIDKNDLEWARVEAVTLDTLSFGLFLARVAKGATISVEQSLVNGEVWFPARFRVALRAKALMLIGGNYDVNVTFHDFRKYQVDSVITPVEELQ